MTVQVDRARVRRERAQALAREDILDAALRCFAQRGYAQTKIADIATAAGYTAASLYTYFPGKKEIFVAAADRFVSGVEVAVGPPPDEAPADFEALAADIRERIRQLCRYGDARRDVLAFFMRLRWSGEGVIEEINALRAEIACAAGEAPNDRHGPHRIHHYFSDLWRALGVERHGIDAEVFASVVGGLVESFFARKYIFLIEGEGGALADDADAIADLVLYGLRGKQ